VSKFVLAFLLFYSFCTYAVFFIDIKWGIYLYELQYFLNPPARWWYGSLPNLRWALMVSICVLIGYIIKTKQYSENRLFDVPQTKWFTMNLMWMLLASNWAVWKIMHSHFLTEQIKLMLFLFLMYKTIDNPKRFEGMMWTLIIGNFYISYETKRKGRDMFGRVEGTGAADTGGDSNCAAAAVITCIPILLYYIVKYKGWRRLLLLFFLAYIMNAVILINSRGSFIGLAVSCSYMGFYVFKDITNKQRFQLIAIVLIGIGLFLRLADDTFWKRMSSITASEDDEEAEGDGGRTLFWMLGIEMVKAHPLGLGAEGFKWMSPQYIPPECFDNAKNAEGGKRAVHSLYIECLTDRGYPGFTIWVCLVLSNFFYIRKIKKHLRKQGDFSLYFLGLAVESGFIAFLVSSAFIDRLYAEILYWFMVFIACFGNIYLIKGYGSEKAVT